MRIALAAALAATTLTAVPALAQNPYQANREYNRDVRDAQREYRDNIRDADNRRDVRDARREYRDDIRDARKDYRRDVRDWRQSNRYDYNRFEPGQRGYYADRYYRDGRYYQTRTLGRNDRIYRGSDNRYYCRRNDGTTGLLVGAVAGGVLGNVIAPGDSKTLGTILGAGAGALLGRSIDRNNVTCR